MLNNRFKNETIVDFGAENNGATFLMKINLFIIKPSTNLIIFV